MMTPPPAPKRGRTVFLVWLLVAFFYFGISWDYIRISWHDDKLLEYMTDIVQRAGADSRNQKEVHDVVFAKAVELGLPVRSEQVVVLGGGTTLSISVTYEADIEVPILDRGVYRKLYQHKVQYRIPR